MSAERPDPAEWIPPAEGIAAWLALPRNRNRCWASLPSVKRNTGWGPGPHPVLRCRFDGQPIDGAVGLWCRHHREQANTATRTLEWFA